MPPAAYQTITGAEAKAMMEDGDSYLLLDVRTDAEYKNQHIAGAILIPYDELKGRAMAELPDKSARILLYCRSGNRSATAAHTLADLLLLWQFPAD